MDENTLKNQIAAELRPYILRLHKLCGLMGGDVNSYWEEPPQSFDQQHQYLQVLRSQGLAILAPQGSWGPIWNGMQAVAKQYANLDKVLTHGLDAPVVASQKREICKALKILGKEVEAWKTKSLPQ